MKHHNSEHYVFHFQENSLAESDISEIASHQEACYRYICDVLNVEPDYKINYYLCETPEEVGHYYGDDEPGNGFARIPDKVYCVCNKEMKCIGFHEDAHLISELIGHPISPAIREGIAMYFDKRWWGIHNIHWVEYFLKTGKYLSIAELINREYFFEQDCRITYPIMGAFTEWLIASYGQDKYKEFYKFEDSIEGLKTVYGTTPEEMNQRFKNYVNLFKIDGELFKRIDTLFNE